MPPDPPFSSLCPADTPFRQQRVKSWLPILQPYLVVCIFFTIGVVFVPLGKWFNDESDQVGQGPSPRVDRKMRSVPCPLPGTPPGCSRGGAAGEGVVGPVGLRAVTAGGARKGKG